MSFLPTTAEKMAIRGELVEEQARKILSGILERAGEGSIRVQSAEGYVRDWLSSKTAL